MADNYTIQDLRDNLNYLNTTKSLIRQAIENKGIEITDETTFREYADKIGLIQSMEDLSAELNAQDISIDTQDITVDTLVNVLKRKASIEGASIKLAPISNSNDILMSIEEICSGFEVEEGIDLTSLFDGAIKLKKVALFDLNKAFSLDFTFRSCSSLEEVANLNTAYTLSMISTFEGCSKLVNAPDFNTSNVTNMSSMFEDCIELVSVPSYNTSKVTHLSNMFANCTKLSNESLNNILLMCSNSKSVDKCLANVIDSSLLERCKVLSNYQVFVDSGWYLTNE